MTKQSFVRLLLVLFSIIFTATGFAENDQICGTKEAFESFRRGEPRQRPPDGPKYVYTQNFIIHFDTTGLHACTRAYAESTAIYAEFSREKQVGALGWAAAPPDYGGPDSRYDIYIQNIPYYGVTYWESPYPFPYWGGWTTFFILRNTMSWDGLRATTAHEYNHGCQCRYSVQYLWWYENVATWMSDICYDDVDYHVICLDSLPNPLWNPNLSIENTSGYYEYAGYLWARFLHEYYGITCLRLIWEKIGQLGGYNTLNAIDSVLRHYDSDLKMALGNYAVWRYFTGDRADTIGHFSESHLWPTSFVDPIHQHNGPGSGTQGSYPLDGPGGTSFIEFYTTPDYLLKSSFLCHPGAEPQVWNIGYSPATGHKQYMMDSIDYWSILPTTCHDTMVLVPTVTSSVSGYDYNYSGVDISATPTPPQDPELEICSIVCPADTTDPNSNLTPCSIRRNNATKTPIDTSWVSFYIGDCYCDSREIGLLNPGQTDTLSFADWTALGINSLPIRCVGGGGFDADITNNCCDTSAFIPWSDVEVLEILAPRGIVAQDEAVEPRVLLRNNGTSSDTVFVSFAIQDYTDTNSIYLEPDSSAELSFDSWMPTQPGVCTTRCLITTPDQRPCNDLLAGEVLVDSITALEENQIHELSQYTLQVTPNPFHQKTHISYKIQNTKYENENTTLRIYDVVGNLVKSFRITPDALQNTLPWDGRDNQNRTVGSGVYFVRFQTDDHSTTVKVLLIR